MPPEATTVDADPGLDQALEWIEALAEEVGPRRPTGRAEAIAAELMRSELGQRGVEARLEPFSGYSSFSQPYGLILAATALCAVLPRHPRLRFALAAAAALALSSEGGLVHTPLSRLLSRRCSQNVVATIEPRRRPERTLCLVSHLDTSRSGLLFHAALNRHLSRIITVQAASILIGAAEPLLGRNRIGRRLVSVARMTAVANLALLLERELRGVDVPGANDNASGIAVTSRLAVELVQRPLASTRVVLLICGCEESGLLGAQAFLRENDTDGWLFVNFDSVGGPGTLRFIRREGIVQKWDADPALLEIAGRIARDRPDIGLAPADGPIGLTYDTTAVMARGGRAITFVAGDGGVIPNYHRPSDTPANLDPANIGSALEAGRELLAAADRGEADLG